MNGTNTTAKIVKMDSSEWKTHLQEVVLVNAQNTVLYVKTVWIAVNV